MENGKIIYSEKNFSISSESYTEFMSWKEAIKKVFGKEGEYDFTFHTETDQWGFAGVTSVKVFSRLANTELILSIPLTL